MKKYFIFVFIITNLFIFSQDSTTDQSSEKKKLTESDFNEKIFEINLTKEQIFDKSILWIAENFKSAKSVLEIQDKTNGKIIGNSNFDIPYLMSSATINFTISIDIKDGKYRITYTNLIIDYYRTNEGSADLLGKKRVIEMSRQLAFKRFIEINKSLNDYMNKKEKAW